MKSEALQQLENISTGNEVEKIEAYIDYLETRVDNLEGEKESLKDQVNDLEYEAENEEHSFTYPAGYNRNIVTDLVLGKLFDNFGLIPLDKLEKLIDKYAK